VDRAKVQTGVVVGTVPASVSRGALRQGVGVGERVALGLSTLGPDNVVGIKLAVGDVDVASSTNRDDHADLPQVAIGAAHVVNRLCVLIRSSQSQETKVVATTNQPFGLIIRSHGTNRILDVVIDRANLQRAIAVLEAQAKAVIVRRIRPDTRSRSSGLSAFTSAHGIDSTDLQTRERAVVGDRVVPTSIA